MVTVLEGKQGRKSLTFSDLAKSVYAAIRPFFFLPAASVIQVDWFMCLVVSRVSAKGKRGYHVFEPVLIDHVLHFFPLLDAILLIAKMFLVS